MAQHDVHPERKTNNKVWGIDARIMLFLGIALVAFLIVYLINGLNFTTLFIGTLLTVLCYAAGTLKIDKNIGLKEGGRNLFFTWVNILLHFPKRKTYVNNRYRGEL